MEMSPASASEVASVLGYLAGYLPSGADLLPVGWALPGRARVWKPNGGGGGFPSKAVRRAEVGRPVCMVLGPVRPVFQHVGGGQEPLGLPPALVSGRAALMSDPCWRRPPLWLYGAPTFCGPGLLAQRGLCWPPASPCSHDRHRWPSQFTASLPARPHLAFPTGGGRGKTGRGARGDPWAQLITSLLGAGHTSVPTQEWPQGGRVLLVPGSPSWAGRAGASRSRTYGCPINCAGQQIASAAHPTSGH